MKRSLLALGATATATAALMLGAGPASAAGWLSDPAECVSTATAVSRVVDGRTVEVRYGTCWGGQHGWGRILGYKTTSTDYIRFEVDTDGDRVANEASYFLAGVRNYTAGWPTSTSSKVAFRACYVTYAGSTCNSANATSWW
ncbi:hypothetical protein ACH4ND_03635 [Streptomyces sp. NPDC017179]|uniref:hypothetical protein n=1 Tax=Streptomyces sp. NPDC017179 TaxID=3364979 RepID=UPI0037AF9F6A